MDKQKCTSCGGVKGLDEFSKRDIKNNIYHKYCKICVSIKQKKWRKVNEEIIKKKAKEYRLNNPEIIKERKRRDYLKRKEYINKKNKKWYYKKKKELGYAPDKLKAEERRFGRERKEILERDDYKCQECESKKMVVIHHIDKTGRTVTDNHNNRLDNLITLCRKCHINIHRKDLENKRKDIK